MFRRRLAMGLGSVAVLAIARTAHADPEGAPAPPPTDEVLIGGAKADTLKKNAGSGTVITEKEIQAAQPESTGELLRRVPGLQVRQEDPMGLRLNLGVRGLSPTRSRLVLVEEDGVPVVVSPYGEPELYYMTSTERIQQLDVVKGSDVLRYGPQTVGAVIRLHTFEPTEKPSWFVSGTGGTRDFGEGLARYSDTYKDVGYVAQAFYKAGAGYRGMSFHAADAFAKANFATGTHGELHAKIAFHSDDSKTTYTGLTDYLYRQNPRANTVAPDDHFGIQRYEASLQHEQHLGRDTVLRTSLFAYHMDLAQRLQDFDRSRLPAIDYVRIADPSGMFFRNTTSLRDRAYDVAGLSTEIDTRFLTGDVVHHADVGARVIGDHARRKLSMGQFPTADSGDLLTDDATTILGLSGWAEDQIALRDYLVVTPAFRVEHSESSKTTHRISDDTQAPHDVDLTGHSSSTGLMPGLGFALGSADLAAFSSLYVGYSAPRVSQSILPGGQDANLDAERSNNYELGVRGRLGKWFRAEADTFFIHFNNQLVSNNPLSGNTSEFVNGGKTRHFGAEATVTTRIGAVLDLPIDVDLGAHYTFVRSRFAGGTFDGKAIPYSPAHTATFTLDAGQRNGGLSGQVALSYIGQQYTDEQNTVATGPTGLDGQINPYTTLDLGARYFHPRTGLHFGLSVKNVLDKVYVSDRLPNGIFTAGFRQVFGTISWTPPQG